MCITLSNKDHLKSKTIQYFYFAFLQLKKYAKEFYYSTSIKHEECLFSGGLNPQKGVHIC